MTASQQPSPPVFSDRALPPATALQDDDFERRGYAEAVVSALSRVGADDGFVVSVEGRWGCGKTSCLAMIEALLRSQPKPTPVVVHFNPWLVGDRDQLLTQFLNALALALGRSDAAEELKGISDALKNYSNTLEFIGLIPGAEPWTSILKSVLRGASKATGGIAEQKKKSIEDRKLELEVALRKSGYRVVVFIDDIDRLYPTEAYEMVRIIKAVGSLPNVGFVVAWDTEYVAQALSAAQVPNARDYLRKVVQIPLPVPPLTEKQKLKIIDAAIRSLGDDATRDYFPEAADRLSSLYYTALRKLIETPRDVNRLFNAVSVAERGLRGEIVLADIIGLACINQFAPSVFLELQREPGFFLDGSISFEPDQKESKKQLSGRLDGLLTGVQHRKGVEDLLYHLFPNLAKGLGRFAMGNANPALGHVAEAGRLKIALAMQAGVRDASLIGARRYITNAEQRTSIEQALNEDNSRDFLAMLEDVAEWLGPADFGDVEELARAIARLADLPQVVAGMDQDGSGFRTDDSCISALVKISVRAGNDANERMARAILTDPNALTVAADILRSANNPQARPQFEDLVGKGVELGRTPESFAQNAIRAVETGHLWKLPTPGRILRSVSFFVPEYGARMLAALRQDDPTLDNFAKAFLYHSFSNPGGRTYSLPEDDESWNLISREDLIAHAKERLKDDNLSGHAKVAWRSVVEGKKLMGNTGEPARH